MKTLHVSTEWNYRGGEQQVLLLVQGIRKEGHEADLFCQPDSGLYGRAREERLGPHPLRMRGEVDVIAAWKIARKISQEQYDIVHSHTPHALSLAAMASLFLKRKPLRLVTRRVQFSIFRHNFLGLNHYKYRKGVDHIIAISKGVKKQLLEDGIQADMLSVVHSGIDPNRFCGASGTHLLEEFSVPSGAPVLGNIGFLEENKGQDYLLRAVKAVTVLMPDVRLFILGEGRREAWLKNLAQELKIEKNVIFPGFRKDVGDFLKIFDLLVTASIEEGLSTTVLEALALRVPVVGTDVGGIPEIVCHQKTGYLVPPANAEALAEGILWMLNNRDQAKKLADEGCRTVNERFTATAMVRKNIAVYQRLNNARQGKRKNQGDRECRFT